MGKGKYKNVIDFESTGTGESRLMISFMLVIMITTKYNITYIWIYNDNDSINQYFGSLITYQSLSFHILFLDYWEFTTPHRLLCSPLTHPSQNPPTHSSIFFFFFLVLRNIRWRQIFVFHGPSSQMVQKRWWLFSGGWNFMEQKKWW